MEGQLVETDIEADPEAELADVLRNISGYWSFYFFVAWQQTHRCNGRTGN